MADATLSVPTAGPQDMAGGLARRLARYFKAQVEDWYDVCRRLTDWEDLHLVDGATPERLATMRDELRCPPEWILSTLEHLERKWGGVETYLEAAGVSKDTITRVQSKLTS